MGVAWTERVRQPVPGAHLHFRRRGVKSFSAMFLSRVKAVLLPLLLLLLPATLATGGSVPMPGGLMPVPVTDPGVQQAARFALSAYNRASNSLFYNRALRILSARSQVVEGIMYYLTMELVNTQCQKSGGSGLTETDLENCALPPEAEQLKQTCEFKVWSRPWLNDTRLMKMDCKSS